MCVCRQHDQGVSTGRGRRGGEPQTRWGDELRRQSILLLLVVPTDRGLVEDVGVMIWEKKAR